MAITHNAVVVVADDSTSPVGSDEWNAAHVIGAGSVDKAALDSIALTFLCPTGAEMQWPVATPPAGWLIEDGSSQLIASYPDLSALIRSTYGGADASHFYVPDMRGVVPVGYKSGDANFGTLGGTGGEATHLLTAAESGLPAHAHTISGVIAAVGGVRGFLPEAVTTDGTSSFHRTDYVEANTAAAASVAHDNLQPYRVRNFVIKT